MTTLSGRRRWLAGAMGLAVACAAVACANEGGEVDEPTAASSSEALSWLQQAKLTASDGSQQDLFGQPIAISGDTAVVGVPFADINGKSNRGAVYVYERGGSGWAQKQKLVGSDANELDMFGASVAIDGNTLAVGMPDDRIGGTNVLLPGAVYVFVRSGTNWVQQAKLVPEVGKAEDRFGASLALEGDRLVVGIPGHDLGSSSNDRGTGLVYERTAGVWKPTAGLLDTLGSAGDRFGESVALSGDTLLIGSPVAAVGATTNRGAVNVFVKSGTSWTLQQRLSSADGKSGDRFGYSIALVGNTAAVGAPMTDQGFESDHGSVYVYTRNGSTWYASKKLAASNSEEFYRFGWSVGMSGNRLAAGAGHSNWDWGRAYVLTGSGASWSETELTINECCKDQSFGFAVAISGQTVLVGAPTDTIAGVKAQGSMFVFSEGLENAQTCSGDSQCASGHCVDGVCCNEACAGTCRACSSAKTGKPSGQCADVSANKDPDDECGSCKVCGGFGSCVAVPAGTDPKNACPTSSAFPQQCGADGQCDGTGSCRKYAPSGTVCGQTSCSGSSVVAYACNSTGSCQSSTLSNCAPYACSTDTCQTVCTTGADCSSGYVCSAQKKCIAPKTDGMPCAADAECASTHCQQGVCCSGGSCGAGGAGGGAAGGGGGAGGSGGGAGGGSAGASGSAGSAGSAAGGSGGAASGGAAGNTTGTDSGGVAGSAGAGSGDPSSSESGCSVGRRRTGMPAGVLGLTLLVGMAIRRRRPTRVHRARLGRW